MNLGEGGVRVLLVDSDEAFADIAAAHLQQVDADIEVATEHDAAAGLERLSEADFGCVVSDYKMPGLDGLDFLAKVRERDPNLPFILFTGKGSEEIASEAISAGVTDYVRKGGGEQYTILAARIRNAVSRYRAEQAVDETRERFRKLIEGSSDAIAVLDADGTVTYASPAIERFVDQATDEVVGTDASEYVHPDDRDRFRSLLEEAGPDDDQPPVAEFRMGRDDSWRPVEARGNDLLDDPAVEGFVVNVRDVSDRLGSMSQQRELELALDEPGLFLEGLADEEGADVSARGAALRGGDTLTVYLDVEDVDSERVREFGESSSVVESIVELSTTEDGTRFEIEAALPDLFEAFDAVDAEVGSVSPDDGRILFAVAIPDDVDAESFVSSVKEAQDGVELTAQRIRPAEGTDNHRAALTESLTDRQLEVLQYAFFGGYFEWPRTSTGEELAEALDIASPTFQNHLRAAQRKLLSTMFDGEDGE